MTKYCLAFLLLPLYAASQPTIDSLKNVLSGRIGPTEKVDVLNELAFRVRVTYPGEAMAYSQEALRLSEAIDYSIGKCDAWINLGLIYWLNPSTEKSLDHGLRALKMSDSIGYGKGRMDARLLLTQVYASLNDYEKSEQYSREALDLARELNHPEGIARACNALANHYRRRNDEHAVQYYEMGLRHVQSKKDIYLRSLLLCNIALYYVNRNEEVKKAKAYLDEAMNIARSNGNRSAELLTLSRLGTYYKTVRGYQRAMEHLLQAEQISMELGNPGALLEIYSEMIEVNKHAGRLDALYAYAVKHRQLRDSLFDAEKAKQIAEFETLFETEKKNQKIKLLEQEQAIQQIRQTVFIASAALIAGIAVLFYRLQRSRTRKANQLLEVQQLLNEKLQEMDKLKSAFFANISHEFRTPLTLILAPLENELKKKTTPEGKESLLLIRRSANRLLELVNQLLDLSKLEAGKMAIRVKEGDLQQLLSVIAASFDSLAGHKQIHFHKTIDLPDTGVWFDQDKLEKIITNLLANAFKYTPAGGRVALDVRFEDATRLTIAVEDTGTGIPQEEQQFVFMPFYQVKKSTAYPQGTGLGLSLVKELVKLYDGAISLQSEPGAGTRFVVRLPATREAFSLEQISPENDDIGLVAPAYAEARSPEKQPDAESDPLLSGKECILIVEDHIELCQFMSAALQHSGYAVLTARDGAEGLSLAQKFVPNLVLSDLMMPVMDGITLTKKIRDDERTSHIPVILLTAKNEQQSRLDSLRTGADDFLTKPFSPDELVVRIANLIEQRRKLAARYTERALNPESAELSLDEKFIHRARSVVEANMGDYTFSVEKMAEEMCLSRTQLLRKLKALTGLAPTDFIKDLRLKRAAQMIRQKADTITQIGYAVGFNDQSYFTKCFKKEFGVTPSEYAVADGSRATRP